MQKKKEKIIFPGKFNPPHLGHIQTINKLVKTYNLAIDVVVTSDIPKNSIYSPEQIKNILDNCFSSKKINIKILEGRLIDYKNNPFGKNVIVVSGNPKVIEWAEGLHIKNRFIGRSEGELMDSSTLRYSINPKCPTIEMVEINKIKHFERPDFNRVTYLMNKIKNDKRFTHPVVITEDNILIDGYNRIFALHALGIRYIPAIRINYDDIVIEANAHYIQEDVPFSLFKNEIFHYRRGYNKEAVLNIKYNDQYYHKESRNLIEDVGILSEFVNLYKAETPFTRKSEGGNGKIEISFKRFDHKDIIIISSLESLCLETGITWHRVPVGVVGINIPLEDLKEGNIVHIKENLSRNNYRFNNNIFINDEYRVANTSNEVG